MRTWILVAIAAALSGCATRAVQTEKLLASAPADLPKMALVRDVSFIEQQRNYCGPATLTMALNHQGKMVDVEAIAAQTLTKDAHGSYQTDLISAARRNGMLAVELHGLPSLLREVAADHPVIVFENLAFKWYPMYHYALVYGYDLKGESVTMHSGPVQAKVWDMRKFERSWMLGDYWGLVVLPPGTLAASVDDLAHVSAGIALEQLNFKKEARQIYESVVSHWPKSLSGLIALSNLDYAEGAVARATNELEQAVTAHESSAAAWHNLAIAQQDLATTNHDDKLRAQARESARRAMQHATTEERTGYRNSLRELL